MNQLRLRQKRQLINLIREFFTDQDFFELETPLLVPSPGMEVHLHSFSTRYVRHDGSEEVLHLPTSPEFAIKKALGAGFEKVFEIARVFRNHGELGPLHHPEFNMLEWYRPGSYLEIMDDVDALFKYLSTRFSPLNASLEFSWDEGTSRTSIEECFRKYANLNLKRGLSDIDYWSSASQASLQENIASDDSFEDIFFRVWLKLIEPNLGVSQPEIVFDYPASMAALAKLKAPEDVWSERFEVYIKGVEIGNAFSELTDSAEQDRRFREANEQREGLGHPPHPIDQTFIDSVGEMPRTGGIAIGVERLLMVLTGETDISQFFLYPLSESSAAVKRT
ncbi:MAG: EF-P lysine aminoacylase GenX [Candidatus Marinimicrobia bacterium]|nr:EF-P lysine aminoacylase GenX [Candidatus Neomarinimicrobiota bacterium]